MPQPKKGPRFGGDPAHSNMILANLTTELIRHGRITTTHAKAKSVQPLAEKMITFAKRGDLHARRQVLKVIRDREMVHKLFAHVGPAFAEREGGYTRVLKTGPRKGDAAPMALIELVEVVSIEGDERLEEERSRRWSLRRRSKAAAAGEAPRAERAPAAAPAAEVPTPEQADASTVDRAQARDDDEDAVQADPAEVEARLAAEEDEPEGAAEDDATVEAVIDADEPETADEADEDEDDDKA